ncbi:Uncharacterised protein [Mycobacteroides abscessus subsp. abscessus]|nr:Uncharacterised protein [Mycobacteroides abscessus subsp. abscessus]
MLSADLIAIGAIRADERGHRDNTGVGKDLGHGTHAADILGAICRRESEVGVEAVPQVVAVEPIGRDTSGYQAALQFHGDGGFSGGGQSGDPDRATLGRALVAGNRGRMPDDLGLVQGGAGNHARRDRVVGGLVHQNETARGAVAPIGIEHDRALQSQLDTSDLVELELFSLLITVQAVDVEPVVESRDGRLHRRVRVLHHEPRSLGEGGHIGEPAHHGVYLSADQRPVVRPAEHVAAAQVQLVGELHTHRAPRERLVHYRAARSPDSRDR